MQVLLDRTSRTPVFGQIVEQIRTGIIGGRIPLGSTLPTVRQLATELGIAYLTVHKAYGELQGAGLVIAEPRQATRVVTILPSHLVVDALSRITVEGPLAGYERLSHTAGLRSLASSVPDPSLFHADEFLSEIEALRRESPWLYYYCDPAGVAELLEQIRLLLATEGVPCSSSDLLVTHGGTHALSLLLSSLAGPADTILVQEPGPLGLRELLACKGMDGIPVRLAGSGIDFDHLEALVAHHAPKAILVSPDFGHCTGLQMPLSDRLALAEFAQRVGIRLIEDRSFAALNLSGERLAPLVALDPAGVCMVGSFSYSLAPGLRTGYLRAPGEVRLQALARLKAEEISGIGFHQVALARYLARGAFEVYRKRVLPKYRARRDAMLGALKTWMPDTVSWTSPLGGCSTWLTLNPALKPEALYRRALAAGVPLSPGSLFLVDSGARCRLSYGVLPPESIREAVRVLAELTDGGPRKGLNNDSVEL